MTSSWAATLSDIRHGGHHLRQDVIRLGGKRRNHKRLTFLPADLLPPLLCVRAQPVDTSPEPVRQWKVVPSRRSSEKSHEYLFDTEGFLPVDRLGVELSQKNSMASVSFFSRPTEKSDWSLRAQGIVYDFWIEEQRLTPEDFVIVSTKDRYWKMVVEERSAMGLGATAPDIRLGWSANKLIFVARGSGPFLPAFGSGVHRLPVSQEIPLLESSTGHRESLLKPLVAVLGERITLGGEAALKPSRTPLPWRRIVLWAVLVLGVVLMMYMARQLLERLRTPPFP